MQIKFLIKMKLKTIIIGTVVLLAAACKKDFLELEPQSTRSAASFFQTQSDIEQGVIGAYDALQSSGQYGENYVYFMEVRSENSGLASLTNSGGIYGDFEAFSLQASNVLLNTTWEHAYGGIQRCNIVLNRINEISMDEAVKNRSIGELKFIRALTYFNLVRIWGEVPLVTEEIVDPFDGFDHRRNTIEEVYVQIIADLEDAQNRLAPVSTDGRISRGAAKTLMAKVRLTRKEYAAAASICQEIIQSGNYQLVSDFANLFSKDNKNNEESIFEIQFKKGSEQEGSGYANLFAPLGESSVVGEVGNAYGRNLPTDTLLGVFDSSDNRLSISIQQSDRNNLYTAKFQDIPFADLNGDNNFIVLRYADVLLMAAEALNETNGLNQQSIDYLNQVRSRAGIANYSLNDFSSKEDFTDSLFLERQKELCFENHRWFDLIRSDRAVRTMNGLGFNIAPHQVLFPVPQTQIDINPGVITQNTGY